MKKVAIGLAVVLVLVAGVLFWAWHSLDVIVKYAVEHYGPDVLGTTVKVAEVNLSAQTGEGALKGLEIGSPRGYSAPRAARFGEIRLALDPATITEDVILVREIRVDAPIITFERARVATTSTRSRGTSRPTSRGRGERRTRNPRARPRRRDASSWIASQSAVRRSR
jgi:hypothetical protein